MPTEDQGPMRSDAHRESSTVPLADGKRDEQRAVDDARRLLELVRRMPAAQFASVFRNGLAPAELMRVIAALSPERRGALIDRARRVQPPAAAGRVGPLDAKAGLPLGTVIRMARKQAGMSQVELAAALGIHQSSVSQWERGTTEPSTQSLLTLMGVLPGVAETLSAAAAEWAGGGRPEPAAGTQAAPEQAQAAGQEGGWP
jgi:DNA-binding XRE family transcriptional regulator